MDSLLSASNVARLLNVKTGTLSKWRRTGKGPSGWKYASETLVLYPKARVLEFIASMPTESKIPAASLSNLNLRRTK